LCYTAILSNLPGFMTFGCGFLVCSVDYSFACVPCLVGFICMDCLPVFDYACTLDYVFGLPCSINNPLGSSTFLSQSSLRQIY